MTDAETARAIADVKAELTHDKPAYGYAVVLRARLESAALVIDDQSKKLADMETELTAAHNQLANAMLLASHQLGEIERLKTETRAAELYIAAMISGTNEAKIEFAEKYLASRRDKL